MKFVCLRKSLLYSSVLIFSLFLVLISLYVDLPGAMAAPSEEPSIQVLEGAKKEGKLMLYLAGPLEVGLKMLKQFHDKYPFIQTDVYRTGSAALLTKVLAEEQSKKYLVDVVLIPGGEAMTLKKKDYYAKYISPQARFFPEGFKDPEGSWTDVYVTENGMAYNTKLVAPHEAPNSWKDLLNPKWKGKIGWDMKSYEWFGYILKMMGEKNGLEYMKKLSEQNVKFYTTRTLTVQLVAAGELAMTLSYRGEVELMKDQGAPMEWAGIEPIIPSIHPIGIAGHAPHPNAAKLFIDFALSREGQEGWARVYRFPSRPDVKPLRLKKDLKLLTPDFEIIGDFQKYGKPYREILMKQKQ